MKNIKKWWNNRKYWQKGAIIGFLVGLSYIPFGLGFGSDLDSFLLLRKLFILWDKVFMLYLVLFCKILSAPRGESCTIASMVSSLVMIPIIFLLLGILIGYIVQKMK